MTSPAGGVILSPTEQKDLDKFTKYLGVKAVQVIVQARLGEKVSAPSKPDTTSGTSWFNLAVKDNHEVMQETKRAMAGGIPQPGAPLVCEISLKTAEGDSLVLECWRLAVVAGGDPGVKVTHTVYNRMSLLLKSLVTVARVTPAYRLSRRQGLDSYVICYRVFLGDPPETPNLGEGALSAKVGQVTTPNSTIVCCVDYRTNMTITQRPPLSTASQPILVKSDHFEEGGGRQMVCRGRQRAESGARLSDCESSDTGREAGTVTSDESQESSARVFATSPLDRPDFRPRTDSGGSISSQERFRVGAFAGGPDNTLPSLEEELANEPLLQLLPRRGRPNSAISVTSGETVSNTSACTDTDTQFLMSSDSGSKVQVLGGEGSITKVVSSGEQGGGTPAKSCEQVQPTTTPGKSPLQARQQQQQPRYRGRNLTELLDREPADSQQQQAAKQGLVRRTSGGSLFGTTEIAQDFVMVDLKTPFAAPASTSSADSDPSLGSFFKEVSSAPQLGSLGVTGGVPGGSTGTAQPKAAEEEGEGAAEAIEGDMWTSQINCFEESLQEYDELLNTMGTGSDAELEGGI